MISNHCRVHLYKRGTIPLKPKVFHRKLPLSRVTIRRAAERKLDILRVKGPRCCPPKVGRESSLSLFASVMLICIAWQARFPQAFTCYKAGVRCMSLLLRLLFFLRFFAPCLFAVTRALLSVLIPTLLLRTPRPSFLPYPPLPLVRRLNERGTLHGLSSTSLLIKWPRESAPGFFNDEILLAADARW